MVKGNKFVDLIKRRLKFYVLGYIIGLMGPLVTQLKQKEFTFFPLNLLAILCAVGLGTAMYYGAIKVPIFTGVTRYLKYAFPIVIIVIVATMVEMYLNKNYGINIKTYIGF